MDIYINSANNNERQLTNGCRDGRKQAKEIRRARSGYFSLTKKIGRTIW